MDVVEEVATTVNQEKQVKMEEIGVKSTEEVAMVAEVVVPSE